MGKIFQVLEVEALETPMLYLDGIKRAKGEEETTYPQSISPIEPVTKLIEEMSADDAVE